MWWVYICLRSIVYTVYMLEYYCACEMFHQFIHNEHFSCILAVQQKDTPLSTSTSAVTLVSSSPANVAIMAASSLGTAASSSPVATDLYIPTASADVAADIAKYTNKVSICLGTISNGHLSDYIAFFL